MKILISVFVILVIFGVVSISGCTNSPQVQTNQDNTGESGSEQPPQTNEPPTDNDDGLPTLDELGVEFVSLAEFSAMSANLASPSECETATLKDDCIINVAIEEGDIGYCSFASDYALGLCIYKYIRSTGETEYLEYCAVGDASASNICIPSIALLEQNPDYCFKVNTEHEISSKDNNCVKNIAISKNDISICEEIYPDRGLPYPGIATKDICKAIITQDEEKCLSLESIQSYLIKEWIGPCLDNVAFLKNDVSICEEISDEDVKRYCRASILKDISECGGDEFCIKLAAIRSNDVTLCEALSDNYFYNECYGVINRNINQCDNIESLYNRNNCKFSVNLIEAGLKVSISGHLLKK